jgi:ribonuclease HI
MTYYVVFEGRVPGVYGKWKDCLAQVHKFSGNCYQGYQTRQEAEAMWREHLASKNKNKMRTCVVLSLLLIIAAVVVIYFLL